MEDGIYLSAEDRKKLEDLKKELLTLKAEHKEFASRKSKISPEDREKWKINSRRSEAVHIEIRDLRQKNILEAGR
jgi:hypothetical protein